ncbi:hypothetical protein EDB83DRAFT_2549625 [Lactarius deliciosus]|nr:hypothetical protein EDB83DRAFT_2549625 [Lactarius deliciosus]
MKLPSVSENTGDSPREYLASSVVYDCFRWAILVSVSAWLTVSVVWLTILATTMPGLQSDISESLTSRAAWSFPFWERVMLPWVVSSANNKNGECPFLDGKSSSSVLVPSAQLCLRARDFIQLGRSRVYAETVDELRNVTEGVNIADVSAWDLGSADAATAASHTA